MGRSVAESVDEPRHQVHPLVEDGDDGQRLIRDLDREDEVVLTVNLTNVGPMGEGLASARAAFRKRFEALDESRLVAALLRFTPGPERVASDLPQVVLRARRQPVVSHPRWDPLPGGRPRRCPSPSAC